MNSDNLRTYLYYLSWGEHLGDKDKFKQQFFSAYLSPKDSTQVVSKNYNDTPDDLIEKLSNDSRIDNLCLHIVPQRIKARSLTRKNIDVEAIRNIVADIDRPLKPEHVQLLVEKTKPSMVVESSPNQFHFYWSLKPGTIKPADHSALNQLISESLGSDDGFTSACHTVRVPGFERVTKAGKLFTPRGTVHRENLLHFDLEAIQSFKKYLAFGSHPSLTLQANGALNGHGHKTAGTLILPATGTEPQKYVRQDANGKECSESDYIKYWAKRSHTYGRNKTLVSVLRKIFSNNLQSVATQQPEEIRKIISKEAYYLNSAIGKLLIKGPMDREEVDTVISQATKYTLEQIQKTVHDKKKTLDYLKAATEDLLTEEPVFKFVFGDSILQDKPEARLATQFSDEYLSGKTLYRYQNEIFRMDTNLFVFSPKESIWKIQDLNKVELKALVKETLQIARHSNAFGIKCTVNSKFNNEKAENENNKLFSARKINDVTNLLTANDKMIKKFNEELDAENDSVATKSELVSASTLKQRARKPQDFITCMTTADYVSSATCPRFLKFLNDVFKQNESQNAMVEALQVILGYSFTGSNSGEHVFCHIGGGSNGKSTLFEVLLDIAGTYGETLNGDFLTLPSHSGGSPRGMYQMHMPLDRILYRVAGRRFIIVDDLKDENREWNEEVIKAVTGTKISIRPEYEKARTVPNRVKLHIGMNGFPKISSDNYAMKRRFYLIPYKREFTPDAVYKQKLMKALYGEKDGIFTWIMKGANKWANQGLPSVDEMNQFADETFLNSLNVMDETLYTENFQAIPADPNGLDDYADWTPARELYNFYLKRVKEMRVQSYDDMIKFGTKLGKYFKVKPVKKKYKGQSVSWWPIRARAFKDESDL